MRRGHPGIGGWRSENQRHFRPRGNGPPRFRHPRIYPLLESPRFPPPTARQNQRAPSFSAHGGHPDDLGRQDHHDRHREYRDGHRQIDQRMPESVHHQRPRSIYQYVHPNLRSTDNQYSSHKETTSFYEDAASEPFRVNSMGDIDQRQLPLLSHPPKAYSQQQISPWANPPPGFKKLDHDDRSQNFVRHHDIAERNKTPAVNYTGHRPPASDHYGGTSGPSTNNNDTSYTGHRPPASDHYGGTSGPSTNNNDTSFTRSVHDTVNIVREKIMNRNDPDRLPQEDVIHQSTTEQEGTENTNQHIQPEQPAKKRTPRQRHKLKSNCDKMKSNIVHQLFKMDKDKMHKLMDDPGCSSKFEYAISSLITESQNSLNRHLRSVAEKSLYSSSTDFIHNDNNTIYEDTFMKQMQCLLDPQDTVLLEDIKPIVMAELGKVLQLSELEQRFDVSDEHSVHHTADGQPSYQYFEPYNYDDYSRDPCFEQDQQIHQSKSSINYEHSDRLDVTNNSNKNSNYDHEAPYGEVMPLFERRPSKRSDPVHERKLSIENRRKSLRRSLEIPVVEPFKCKEEPLPLFDGNTDQLSEEEDTFAELDRQYHVAVDHNFIENDDLSREPPKFQPVPAPQVIDEIDSQLQTIAQSSSDLFPVSSRENLRDIAKDIKQELVSLDNGNENATNENTYKTSEKHVHKVKHIKINQDYVPQPKDTEKETEKAGSSNIIKNPPSNSRKRSIDQRPSHRKEKRKKHESSQSDSAKPDSDKNVPAYANSNKSNEKCNDAPKPYYNIFLPKAESSKETKDTKKIDSSDKSYSDKYVKRKETSKKPKEKESESGRKRHSSTCSQTIPSPKDSINTNSQTSTTSDPKIKLKTFDMFVEQPKKASSHHHAHRNTAVPISPTRPAVEENILKQVSTIPITTTPIIITSPIATTTPTPIRNKTAQTKHVGTQVIRRVITKETQTFQTKTTSTRFSQTERKKLVSKYVQTLAVPLEISKPRSADAFERMKEIDTEIQVLIQEKFKLYSSLESKDTYPSTMGMTVLNVTPIDESRDVGEDYTDSLQENIMNEDEIVDNFANIPVEELEQIAIESVEEESTDLTKVEKRTLRQKVLQERKSSESPTSSKKNKKKAKPPNISLLEQIITDDRPLEDIISLDDLEEPQSKTKKKPRSQPKKKSNRRTKPQKNANSFDLKDCSVVLIQTDVTKFIKDEPIDTHETSVPAETGEPSIIGIEDVVPSEPELKPEPKPKQDEEDSVVNDLQFDMLDVSEDIVIGEESEVKSNDKDMHGRETVNEEIILDNSQSSADDVSTAVSGQAENECKTYDYSTDEKLRRDSVTVTGNADAVLAIECIETDFIAACLDGNVYHFSGDGQLRNTLRGSNLAVTCLTIVREKYGTTVYTGSLDSRIRYYDLETGLEKGPECNVLSPIQTMDRAWDTVFVGTRTGFVLQFECKNNMLIPVSTVKFSEQSILALRAMKEGPRKVLLVAARSENVTIKDAQTGLLLRTLSGPKMTVYTLLFEDGKVFCGTSSHQIHVFEYSSGSHTGCHEGGKGAVCLRATGGLLFAGCYDGCIYVYREGETRPLAQLRGPSLMLLSLAVVGSKIIAGYKDRSLYIWKIPLSILQEMIL